MSRQVGIDRESCCDDLAVAVCGGPVVYALDLADLEILRGARPAFALGADGGSLLDRVRRLARRAKVPRTWSRSEAGLAAARQVPPRPRPRLPADGGRDRRRAAGGGRGLTARWELELLAGAGPNPAVDPQAHGRPERGCRWDGGR